MPLLGCIADDFTGATDLASMLVREGMRSIQVIGVPEPGAAAPDLSDIDAVVVALKSRTIPVADAIDQSRRALAWLRQAGCERVFFKYCSTFDSTPEGNIGPVTEALQQDVSAGLSIACPAFPENNRTIVFGHLFVGHRLLNDSGMEHHPLTPMTDADLVRWLGRQTTRPVGLVPWDTVAQGPDAIRAALDALAESGHGHAVVDALDNAHLRAIGAAVASDALVTGGSGVAIGLPDAWRAAGLLGKRPDAAALPRVEGPAVVLSGSCSRATLGQVAWMKARRPALALDPLALFDDPDGVVGHAVAFLTEHMAEGPVLVHATAAPESVRTVQDRLGRDEAGALVERAFAAIARQVVEAGARRLVVAGGETSGAVVSGLGVSALRIGPMICPGVPWTVAERAGDGPPLALALKSGNFGAEDFFLGAFDTLDAMEVRP
ncbi:3-oxo-tetronate kinase [Roseospira navarrensis]|nr:3-oxo-tetronate kinase [Roseospira navarrensis]